MLLAVVVSAVLALSVPAVQGQVYGWGGCPNVPTAQNFAVDRWLGTWIEIARFPSSVEENVDCGTDTYTRLQDGRIEFKYAGIRDGQAIDHVAPLYAVFNPEAPAKFNVPYFDISFLPEMPYWILEIDHDPETGYFVGYTCMDAWIGNMQILWIFSKEREMDEERLNGILGRLEGYGIDVSELEYVRQDDTCPALP
ncbi:APOD [Branchiostoma lanceolatum]|uniref:Apolipoprotein D n=1 Tax=Branchiostoma lanceolatum TaxID=7740 RepID=A0A8J9YS61_BRALA|nr:APOD [Branchiostoma lanceolatum]